MTEERLKVESGPPQHMIDEPADGQHYGGAVAAPVFAQVMQGALRMLAVPHDAPLEPVMLPGEGEEAKEST